MFNSYSSSQGGSACAYNNLKINAISGNLVKNHPLSIFVTATSDSTLFEPTNPRYTFPNFELGTTTKFTEKWNGSTWTKEPYKVEEMKSKEVPCTVLQAMIIGENLFLCEIIKTEDFFKSLDFQPKESST